MPIVDLDDERAEQVSLVGAKAARLAKARRRGLPVLPGVVVPAPEAGSALARGRSALTEGGPSRARLEVTRSALSGDLVAALSEAAVRLGGERFIVRSSSVEEVSAVWGGAFPSYPAVATEDIAPSVRACWASVFTRDVLERCEAVGVAAGDVTLAVLVQPHLQLEAGGVATVNGDGSVTVIGGSGSPEGLMSGLAPAGCTRVGPGGDLAGGDLALGPSLVRKVADLARHTSAVAGCGHVEWGVAGGSAVLLQLQPLTPAVGSGEPAHDPALASGTALHVARLVHRFRGALGESLVLPWALGLTAFPRHDGEQHMPSGTPATSDARVLLAQARRIAEHLTGVAWGLPPAQAQDEARRALRDLRGPEPARALAAVERLRPVDVAAAHEALTLLTWVAARLAATGAIGHPRELWRLSRVQLEAALEGEHRGSGGTAPPHDVWDPFLCGVLAASGRARSGIAASPGVSAGELWHVSTPSEARRFPAGALLLAPHPLAWLAPLLWRASGLVTWSGSPGAHLIEVARSLGVPAVVSCPVEAGSGTLSALDGEGGVVWLDPAAAGG